MKHVSRLAFISFAAFTLTACGGSSERASPSPAAQPTQTAMTPFQRGERLYRRCIACHTLGQGEKHKVGPNLYGVFGQVAGGKENFNYSKAMKASEIVWSEETLNAYLKRPRDYIPGNRMSFIGLKKAEDRSAVIEYMKVKTASED